MSALGLPPLARPFRRGVLAAFHFANSLVADVVEGGELGVAEDGGLDVGDGDRSWL